MASFTKRVSKKGVTSWLVQVFCGYGPDGKKTFVNRTSNSPRKKDAQALARELLAEQDRGELVPTKGKVTVAVLLDGLTRNYEINGQDTKWAKIVVNKHLRPAFGGLPAHKLTSDAIEVFIRKRLAEGAKPQTVNHCLALLRRAYNLALEATPPKVSRVPRFKLLAVNNVRKGFFEQPEYEALFAELDEDLRPVLAFGYFTGCRRGEILKLCWSQVDLEERIVRLEPGTTKNDEGRTIPLAPQLYELLAMRKAVHDHLWPASPWVFFRTATGDRVRNFKNAWARACRRAGLWTGDAETGKATRLFHDLRRSGVRNLVRAGVPEAVAQRISGHKTRAVFDRYNIVSEQDLKDAARRLGEYLASKADAQPESAGSEIPTFVQHLPETKVLQ